MTVTSSADDRRRAARTRLLRGVALVTLSPLAFQLAGPLTPMLGFVLAKWGMTVAAIVLSAAGTSRVVLGAIDYVDAKRALPPGELPSARMLPPRTED